MTTDALTGDFVDAPRDAAIAFRAALDALSRPGTIRDLRGASGPAPLSEAAATLILTLCDAETPVFLAPGHDTAELRDWLAFHTGAPVVDRPDAMFAIGTWEALAPQTDFAIGTPEYPDRSATLIVEVERLDQPGTMLSGPGIRDSAELALPDPGFFAANAALFPLGLDCFFTSGAQVAALPRSTKVEAV